MWFYIWRYFGNLDVFGVDENEKRQRFWNQTAMIYLGHHSSYMKRVGKASLCPVTWQTFEQKWRTLPIRYSSRIYEVSMTSELWESVSRIKGTKSFIGVKISCFCCKVTTACRLVGHSDIEDMRIASRQLGNRSWGSLDWGLWVTNDNLTCWCLENLSKVLIY
jgi:hypothetical protein